MLNAFLKDSTEIETYIDKRLLEIDDLEERREARNLTADVMKFLGKYVENKYDRIRENINYELQHQQGTYDVQIGIIEKKSYDPTEGILFPMIKTDLEEKIIDVSILQDCLHHHEAVKVDTVFLQLTEAEIRSILLYKRDFKCTFHTTDGEYSGRAVLRENRSYQDVLADLFRITVFNGMKWKTINSAYVNKFFDVYVVSGELENAGKIEKITFDFEEYKGQVLFDYLPVWNIEEKFFFSEVSKEGLLDQAIYQHQLPYNVTLQDVVLVADTDVLFTKRMLNEKISIQCQLADSKRWRLYIVHEYQGRNMYGGFPVLSNCVHADQFPITESKAEMIRNAKILGYQERMTLVDIEFQHSYEKERTTYAVDYGYVKPYICEVTRPFMILKYQSVKNDFVQTDILSYIVTAMQAKYREYDCIGEFVYE